MNFPFPLQSKDYYSESNCDFSVLTKLPFTLIYT